MHRIFSTVLKLLSNFRKREYFISSIESNTNCVAISIHIPIAAIVLYNTLTQKGSDTIYQPRTLTLNKGTPIPLNKSFDKLH